MNLRKKVANSELYTEYVKILNGVLHLSNREAEVFSFILAADIYSPHNINSKELRLVILEQLGITDPNLSKYLNTIKSKGLIVRGPNRKWILNGNIRPEVKHGFIEVNITLEIEKNKINENDRMDNDYSKADELEG